MHYKKEYTATGMNFVQPLKMQHASKIHISSPFKTA